MIALTYLEFYSGIGGWGHALEGACRSIAESHQPVQLPHANKHKMSLRGDHAQTAEECHSGHAPLHLRPALLAAFDHSDLANSVFCHNHVDPFSSSSSEQSSSQHPNNKRKRGGKKKRQGPVRQTPIERLTLAELQSYDADVWCMSPPCQPHTRQHGNRHKEANDPRSQSFLHLCRVLGEMDEDHLPALILLENVVGFEQSGVSCESDDGGDAQRGDGSSDAGNDDKSTNDNGSDNSNKENVGSFQTWRRALSRRKYRVAHFHLDPTHVGLPNNRPRHYTVAFRPGSLHDRMKGKTESGVSSNAEFPFLAKKEVRKYSRLFCKEALDKPPIIHDETSLLAEKDEPLPTVPCIGEFLDVDLPPHASNESNPTKLSSLQIPEKVRTSSSAWCFDIVTPTHRRSACFTHSYGKFIRGTGSILYYGPLAIGDGAALDDHGVWCNATIGSLLAGGGNGSNNGEERQDPPNDPTSGEANANPSVDRFALASPEERTFDASWSKDLDWDRQMRYLSGTEIARLMGFPVAGGGAATTALEGTTHSEERMQRGFGFPSGCTPKQQWKLLGNSLNVRVAARVAEVGLRALLDGSRRDDDDKANP